VNLLSFRTALLRWFRKARRPLPWRRTRDAYPIWVSEVMLQQTTVATVIPYYERFIERFPTVESLARAGEDEVVALWSGLGYYSRARNLRMAAATVVERHAGRFPKDLETAMTLKGVGRYTGSAVTSIAYGTCAAVVDGNVRRVLSRLHAQRGLSDARAQELASDLLSPRFPGDWNEAMMELGATICTPAAPRCEVCPASKGCQGRDRPQHWSEGKPRRPTVRTRVDMVLVKGAGRILLTRTPAGELMQGLYELPNHGLPARTGGHTDLPEKYPGLDIEPQPIATVRHAMTHHRIEAHVFLGRLRNPKAVGDLSFFPLSGLNDVPIGALTRKALAAIGLKRRESPGM